MCLTDSGMTSHIFRDKGLFLNYCSIKNMYISGVRGAQSFIKGKGTVILLTTHRTQKTKIKLHNVIHVLDTRHNLISLE